MSNLQTVQKVYGAFLSGDFGAVFECFDPDIEWVEPGLDVLPYAGSTRGMQNVAESVFGVMPSLYESFGFQPEEFVDGGDTVVVLGRSTVKGVKGQEETYRFVHAWQFKDGKVVRYEGFSDTHKLWRTITGAA